MWDEDHATSIDIAERITMLQQLPEDRWCELYLIASIPKSEAIALGSDIAVPVADLLRHLIPLYEAAVRP